MKIVGFEGRINRLTDGPGFLTYGAASRLPTDSELKGVSRVLDDPLLPMGGWVKAPAFGSLVPPAEAMRYELEGAFTRFTSGPVEVADVDAAIGTVLVAVPPVFHALWNPDVASRHCGVVAGPWTLVPCDTASPGLFWSAVVFGDSRAAELYMAEVTELAYRDLLRSGEWKRGGKSSPVSQALILNLDHPGLHAMGVAVAGADKPRAEQVAEVVLGRKQVREAPGGEAIVQKRIQLFRQELRERRRDLEP